MQRLTRTARPSGPDRRIRCERCCRRPRAAHTAASRRWPAPSSRARNRPRPVPCARAREERLENPLGIGRCDARARDRRPAGRVGRRRRGARSAARSAPRPAMRQRMRHAVLAQVPDDLVQLAAIDAHLDVFGGRIDDAAAARQLQRVAEFVAKALSQAASISRLRPRRLAPRELQDVVDDAADAGRVALHDLASGGDRHC